MCTQCNEYAIPECSIIVLYNVTIVSHLSDGKVDAVTFGTGTGGTLSGQYHSALFKVSWVSWYPTCTCR